MIERASLMEQSLFDKDGQAAAYISHDYNRTIYLWDDGLGAAYLYENHHIYGINGRHLGWFVNEFILNNDGDIVGFTSRASLVKTAKEPPKGRKRHRDEIRPRWAAPPFPKLVYRIASENLTEFLKQGLVDQRLET